MKLIFLEWKVLRLNEFSDCFKKLHNEIAKKENTKERESIVLHAVSELYYLLETDLHGYIKISVNKKRNLSNKYSLI